MSLNSIGRVSVHFLGLRSQNSQHEMREIMAPPVNRGALQASHHDAISDEGKKPYFGLTFQAWSVPCGKQVFATPPFPAMPTTDVLLLPTTAAHILAVTNKRL